MPAIDVSDAAWILASGAGTVVGGLAVLLLRRPPDRILDLLLGVTGGVMLAAALLGLLPAALERGGPVEVVAGFAAGVVLMRVVDRAVPHVHWGFVEARHASAARAGALRRAVMLLTALTIHNVPEGLAVGAAFAAGGAELGIPIAVAIGIQNVPEGFVAGVPLIDGGVPRRRAALLAGATGLVEPPAAAVAVLLLDPVTVLLPAALALAAGAMVYVVLDELLPESTVRGNRRAAAVGFVGGLAVMAVADLALR